MADVLLVHGSGHGAWCWRDVIPALNALGHSARAIDLPSHGEDKTHVSDVTLDLYSQTVLDALQDQTIVVGHSMAGYPISCAADRDPSLFARLIYLCAYVPWDNMSLSDMRKAAPRQPIMKAISLAEDRQSFTLLAEHAKDVFYQDCSDDDVAFALKNLCRQAVLPQATKVKLGENYKTVPRSFITCRYDGAIPPEFQDKMSADFDPADVYELATSHSPFLSDPDGLARLIDKIVRAGT